MSRHQVSGARLLAAFQPRISALEYRAAISPTGLFCLLVLTACDSRQDLVEHYMRVNLNELLG